MQDLQTLRDKIHRDRLIGMHLLADWWFDKFTKPNHDNGDHGFPSVMAGALATETAELTSIDATDQGRQKFRDAFVALTQPNTLEIDGGGLLITVRQLADAMKDAGIGVSRAPWKTNTWIDGGGLLITVSGGYRAPQQVLYVAPVLDDLARMSERDLAAIFPEPDNDRLELNYNHRLSLGYTVSRAISTYAEIARCDATRDTPYILESIAKLRATVK